MKKYFEDFIARKKAEAEKLQKRSDESTDIAEVRSIGETLKAIAKEIDDAEKQLAELDKPAAGGEQTPAGEGGERTLNPVAAMEMRNGGKANGAKNDPFDTPEYREAFMNFVCRGVAIPKELRADATTTTADAGAVIPTTILNEIVKEVKSYGNLYNAVRKLNVQGGVQIPILSLVPTATWISADTGTSESDKQKVEAKTSVVFNYYGLECKVAQTLLANVTTLEMFQSLFVPLAVEAMAKAIDIAIMNGTGTGEPLGITKDTRIPSGNIITLTDEEFKSWGGWKKKVFGKMKKAYRKGAFHMAQATFDGYIDGMEDADGQPIGRVNYGIDGEEKYRFGGKSVETVEDDVIKPYDDAASGEVVAVFGDLSKYGFNSNLTMTTVKWVDHDTNEIKNKVILIADGKIIDPYGFLIIKKA